MVTELHYALISGGDGSAHPVFFETGELASFVEENQMEGWGEDCTGIISIHHDGPISVSIKPLDATGALNRFKWEWSEEVQEEFKEKFNV